MIDLPSIYAYTMITNESGGSLMSEMYDIAIVGSGPAGLEAAINATIRNKKIILFGSKNISSKLVKAHRVDNYLGFYGLTGAQIKEHFAKHLEAMNIQIHDEKVTAIYENGTTFMLAAATSMVEARKVILASGVELSKSIENEIEFLGRGVSYCATCDAPLYKGRKVIVVGYSEESIDEANYINEIAEHVVFIPMNIKTDALNKDIEIIKGAPLSIEGEASATSLILRDQSVSCDGIFILRNSVEPSQLMMGIKMDGSHIEVNAQMETSIPGVYAAGDIVGKPYQYMKAAGQGQIAALHAVDTIDKENRK